MRGIFREKGLLGFFQVDYDDDVLIKSGYDDDDDDDDNHHHEDEDEDEDENDDDAVRAWFRFGVAMCLDTFASSSPMR